jgi:hypothetical protein
MAIAVGVNVGSRSSTPAGSRERTEKLQERTFAAKTVLDRCPRSFADDPSRVIWRLLIRSAPAASGILDEADEASSDNEFHLQNEMCPA